MGIINRNHNDCHTSILLSKIGFVLLLLLVIILNSSCSKEETTPSYRCTPKDDTKLIGVWTNPIFASNSTNCFQGECLEITFSLNADSTYTLDYTVTDSQTDSLLKEKHDSGVYLFDCSRAGPLSGRYAFLSFVEGVLELKPDSIVPLEWEIHQNPINGLCLNPGYLQLHYTNKIQLYRH